MSKLNRREFARLTAGAAAATAIPALPLFAKPNSKFNGVQIGVQSYSFRDRSLDACLEGIVECGINVVELWQGHVEPRSERGNSQAREELRKWRTTVALSELKQIGEKFRKAGVNIYAYNYSFRDDFTDPEIERGFEMAKALGAKVITASSNVKTAERIYPFAKKHRMKVGMHNHSNIRPNEFARPEDFDEAAGGRSDFIVVNLDIGHFVAAGFDPVAFLEKNHQRIVTLHLKDRKKDQGANLPFGEGDTPIKEVLNVLKRGKYAIPANIEYEYKGTDSVAEVKKCLEYCKQALA